jgi:hypothetical protein
MASHSNVVVNFNINANATGTIDVFGQQVASMSNFLIANVNIPASNLYTSSNSALLTFQGSNLDGIQAQLVPLYAPLTSGAIMGAVNNVIGGSMNCSNAAPYNAVGYANAYNAQSNFGYVALGAYAHQLFGHVAATAAIDNDSTFVANMIGNNLTSNNHAKIAAILTSNIASLTVPAATAIAKQVIGQDASRAMTVDNDGVTPVDGPQPLKWIAGDVIFMTVTLNAPTVTIAGNVANDSNAQLNRSYVTSQASTFGSNVYPIKITLS